MTGSAFMTDVDFRVIRNLLLEQSAVDLDESKQYLVESRLSPLVRQLNLNSIGELIAQLPGNGLSRKIVEALVTSETSFFRDHVPFEDMRKSILPSLIDKRRQQLALNVWCAACSTGQEPYSVAMLIREHFPELCNWKLRILASDLSQEILARARTGRFKQIEVNRGLPAALLVKYFSQHGTEWELAAAVRGMVEFQEINLAKPWPWLPAMDLILMRNVMIYFNTETKKAIFARLTGLLRPDGYLLLGGAETPLNLSDSHHRVPSLKSSFYQLN
jgi:chemotaxis protein methyltransferase CheR